MHRFEPPGLCVLEFFGVLGDILQLIIDFWQTAREFREELAAHLGCAYPEIVAHTKKGNFYRDITLTAEAKEEYRRAYGYDATEFLA